MAKTPNQLDSPAKTDIVRQADKNASRLVSSPDPRMNGQALTALMDASEAMMRGVAAINEEMVSFATTRFQENLEMSQSLMHCDDLEKALDLQRNFAQKTAEQYLAEATKLLTLTTQLTQASWEPMQHQAEDALKALKKQSA